MPKTRYIISGITEDGKKFRPSDWTERIVCIQPEQLKRYKGHLKIQRNNGVKSIAFDDELEYTCPFTYERILSFAKTNHLQISKESIDTLES